MHCPCSLDGLGAVGSVRKQGFSLLLRTQAAWAFLRRVAARSCGAFVGCLEIGHQVMRFWVAARNPLAASSLEFAPDSVQSGHFDEGDGVRSHGGWLPGLEQDVLKPVTTEV